jgi:hypothetical protein
VCLLGIEERCAYTKAGKKKKIEFLRSSAGTDTMIGTHPRTGTLGLAYICAYTLLVLVLLLLASSTVSASARGEALGGDGVALFCSFAAHQMIG